jgi:hypothetical protein
MLSFSSRLQDARDEALRASLLLWLSQVDPNGDYRDEPLSLTDLLSSALSVSEN